MSDIVEQLHKVGELQGDTYSSYEILGILKQARQEIERLRAELDMLRVDYNDCNSERARWKTMSTNISLLKRDRIDKLKKQRDDNAAEIERLHAELEKYRLIANECNYEGYIRETESQIERLRASNAELLAALNEIVNHGEKDAAGGIWTTGEGHARCQEIARAAIEKAVYQAEEVDTEKALDIIERDFK